MVGALVAAACVFVLGLAGASIVVTCVVFAVTMYFQGWINPNSQAIGLEDHAAHAGNAAALLGSARSFVVPAVGPLPALGGASITVMAGTMTAGLGMGLLVVLFLVVPELRRRDRV